jgi:hypothetical protein
MNLKKVCNYHSNKNCFIFVDPKLNDHKLNENVSLNLLLIAFFIFKIKQ